MEITLDSVRGVFRDVLAGRMTREAADRWAYSLVQQAKSGALIFVPESDRKCIWDGIMYLYGIDILEGPEDYLHTDDDVRVAMRTKLGES